uniref:Ig-like domain-containing protein n=1 Tax=Seriola lalandi dorsalis TaxID=1841481 RepID=A0A3B4WZ85_SERLL
MRWLLAGCCGLALISLSAALQVIQKPRFYGVKPGRILSMYCSSESEKPDTFQWYKADMYDQKPEERVEVTGKRFEYSNKGVHQNAFLYIRNTHREDSGVYFCKMNNATWGPGTEVRVVSKPRMKDGLIIFQGLLLAVSIAAMLLRKHTQVRNKMNKTPETNLCFTRLYCHVYQTTYSKQLMAASTWEPDRLWKREFSFTF